MPIIDWLVFYDNLFNKHSLLNSDIKAYNSSQTITDELICNQLALIINRTLKEAESKIWHAHPVWFLAENPIVGYSKEKKGIRLMFWSGADFGDKKLNVLGKKFKDASIYFNNLEEIDDEIIIDWLKKSRIIQWDYKNIVKRKGQLYRLQ